MKKSDSVKSKIIHETKALIKESKGDVNEITIRTIAEKSGVGTGLINYHFGTKEHLIELCVGEIIKGVVSSFNPPVSEAKNSVENLKASAKKVYDFLFENPSISRISILSDFNLPSTDDNTAKTVLGFSFVAKEKNSLKIFAMVAAMQSAFLRKDISKELFGLNLNIKNERDIFIQNLIDNIYK